MKKWVMIGAMIGAAFALCSCAGFKSSPADAESAMRAEGEMSTVLDPEATAISGLLDE